MFGGRNPTREKEDREREREREREGTPTPIHLDQGNGKSHSDRNQATGRKPLIGQLAPWVTWGI